MYMCTCVCAVFAHVCDCSCMHMVVCMFVACVLNVVCVTMLCAHTYMYTRVSMHVGVFVCSMCACMWCVLVCIYV